MMAGPYHAAVNCRDHPMPLVHREHRALHARAEEVEDPNDPEVVEIAGRMLATVNHLGGYALAAPQVGVELRLIVFANGGCFVNPVLAWLEGFAFGTESCLTLPGQTFLVNRARTCTAMALMVGGDGYSYERGETGLSARVWQHEVDHLNGELINDGQWPEMKVKDGS